MFGFNFGDNNLDNVIFSHYISLGYFCSVSMDLEKLGLRDYSSPFDWLISRWGVENCLNTEFKYFLLYENLYQNKKYRYIYHDELNNIDFYHDFDRYKSLSEQISDVKEKYNRRIVRFLKDIVEPTLFIRYVSNEEVNSDGRSEELVYIENNITKINSLIKKYNKNNQILFIANDGVVSNLVRIYNVPKDSNDQVCRNPLIKQKEVYKYLSSIEYIKRSKNLDFYNKKNSKVKYFKKVFRKIHYIVNKNKQYSHEKWYL